MEQKRKERRNAGGQKERDNKRERLKGGVRRTPSSDPLKEVMLKIRKTKCFIKENGRT